MALLHPWGVTVRKRFPAICIGLAVAAFGFAVGLSGVNARAQQADAVNNPFRNDPAAVAAGMAVFNSTCSVCHGGAGIGGRGPALNTGRLARGDTDYRLFQTVHDGITGTEMPAFSALPANDIWRVVTYIRSLSPSTAPATAKSAAVVGNPVRGETVFFGKGACATCHEVNGRGGDLASDLSTIGARGAAAINDGMAHPPRPFNARSPAGRWVEATFADGRKVRGFLRAEDTFNVVLRGEDGVPFTVPRKAAEIRDVANAPTPPTDIKKRLTQREQNDLFAYLSLQTVRGVAAPVQPRAGTLLSADRLRNAAAEPQNWMTYWGNYNGTHFSELKQIDTTNVGTLQVKWAAQLPGQSALQATPLVVDGVMYVSGSPGEVQAIDARSGLQLWRYVRKQDVVNPFQINPSNRGVAVMDGRVFFGTLDNLMIALDARTGRWLWETRLADTLEGYTITSAPLAVPGKVIIGVAGGEYGLRAHINALDAATGRQLWRFWTIPAPGEPGNETWPGETWKLGGGGAWMAGSYDPDLSLLYWTVGNPAPSFNSRTREGDNLYSNSVVALDLNTGKLRWHYQFTPNDSHDWDAIADVVLIDQPVAGRPRKLLIQANRNGFYYVLDRTNGEFISGKAFVRQNWNDGFDAKGRPKINPASVAGPGGVPSFPAGAATNFQAPSYDHETNRFFVVFNDTAGAIASETPKWEKGKTYLGGRRATPPPATRLQGILAMDAVTGQEYWRFPIQRSSSIAGLLATRGGAIFHAGADGNLTALDMKDGKPLWNFQTGGTISASPISFAVDGKQYIAISAGNTVYALALPDK